jgi:hypothetical protein
MIDKSDAILKLALALAAILIGLSVAYYYAMFLPERARAESQRIHEAEVAKQRSNDLVTERAEKRLAAAQSVQGGDKTSHWSAGIVLSGAA